MLSSTKNPYIERLAKAVATLEESMIYIYTMTFWLANKFLTVKSVGKLPFSSLPLIVLILSTLS